MEYIVRLQDLNKQFGDVVAVDNVTLNVRKGEFLTFLGPSGSGKTTILMMVAGFQTPTSGKIFIEEEMVVFKPPFKRNIGMVFQNYALFPHITVFDNIAFPLRMRKVEERRISEQVEQALNLIQLSGLGKRYPKQLSGGQQQRVALARALVYNPPVLLMDEPLGALDKKLREHMQLEIKHLHQTVGITVIYVTHDQGEALTMSDRIAVMNLGRIEQIGTPNDLYEKPQNKFVADFIGESNFIEAEVIAKKGERVDLITSKGMKIIASLKYPLTAQKVNVVIRPERICFVNSPQEKTNTYQGTVEEVIYIGDTLKYKVSIDPKESLVISQKNDKWAKWYKVGDRILLGWQDEDINLV
jgi:spermidine/putrescine ABC transporter ATP-binding subunit